MSAETEHNEHLDLFSLKVKQKLEDHRLPVDTECWEQIEAKVTGRPRLSVWRIGGWITAAVAILALLFVIRLYEPELVPALDAGTQKNEQIAERTNPKKMDIEKQRPDKGGSFAIPHQARERVVARVAQKNAVVPVLVDTIAWEDAIGEEGEVGLPAKAETAQPEVKIPGVRHRGPEPEKRRAGNLVARTDRPKAKGGKWQVGANMGTGGHLSFHFLDGMDDASNDSMNNDPAEPGWPHPPIDKEPVLDMDKKPESFADIDCAPPLSFGFTVRKNLNNRVALESGLVYTYLYSKMQENVSASYKATLALHYLGVPVNLVIKLCDNPNWNVYLSGGFMMEKGLHSLYRLDAYNLKEHKSATYRSGIDGLQWSLNLSIGVSYRFYRDWSLYLEPRYSYYFDNNQPVSYRTENTTLIGIGAGIRFEF
ncbi:porin family protein [uncultured Parabacteroides sp.]|uniref:porin family protein n=1 Tax=uncultured Parabacteroides sp. TaxID=512312 RepID=UPI0025CE5334|nr:porin family protein [uncultured Parabacteroides sp.]